MADHRAEQILAAITTLVTGLTTTGANVSRDDDYATAAVDLPALVVTMGEEAPVADDDEDGALADFIDTELQILITARAKSTGVKDTTLNLIHKEVVVALKADYTLGLAFVHRIKETGRTAPEQPETPADQPVTEQVFIFSVKYRRSRTDPSA